MKARLEGVTVMTDDVARLTAFYRDVVGFPCLIAEPHYAEFQNEGVRFAICVKSLMADNTDGHPSFLEARRGQAFELNFECATPQAVHELYKEFVSKGAAPVTEPRVKSWGHTTAFFADPDGNIHSLFAVNPLAE